MGTRTEYSPGTFCWIDLMTPDMDGAKSFYSDLFGWTAETTPNVAGGGDYTMFSLDGLPVAGSFDRREDQRDAGIPPGWLSYVSVSSADESAAKARELGGNAVAEPFDVGDAGRSAVVGDPQWAYFALWEPRKYAGAGVVNSPGALTWNELRSPDPSGVVSFYEGLFGWSRQENDMGGGMAYLILKVGSRSNAGIIPSQIFGEGVPPHWGIYFAVADTDETVARVEELGGKALAPATNVPMGRFAAFADPQGANFAVFSGRFDD